MQAYVGAQDVLRVFYRAAPTDGWAPLETYSANVSSWTQKELVLPSPSGTYQIAFEGEVNYGYGVNIDDVEVTGDVVGGYGSWKDDHFGADAGDESIAGDDADPDDDGISNRWEYFYGSNPLVPDVGLGLNIAIEGGYPFLTFPLGKQAATDGVQLELETCTDLANPPVPWVDIGFETIQSPPAGDSTNDWWQMIYKYDDPVSNSPRRFFRLKATAP
jgi:hypothetical protein